MRPNKINTYLYRYENIKNNKEVKGVTESKKKKLTIVLSSLYVIALGVEIIDTIKKMKKILKK